MSLRLVMAVSLALLGCGAQRRDPARASAIRAVEDRGDPAVAPRFAPDPKLVAGVSATSDTEEAPLSVLLVTIDSLRADMPWAGYPREIAPRLTELERRCVTYERAYATASHTAPSVASILYGKYPSELPRDGAFSAVYPKSLEGFPHALRSAGYTVVAGHAHDYLRRAGFASGFDSYALVPGLRPAPNVDPNQTSKALEALAETQLDALDSGEKKPFFAWYHFVDPHAEWLAPAKDEEVPDFGPKPRDRYDAEVYVTDKYVGKLLDYMEDKGMLARTAIVVTSDHGEGIGDHGQLFHGYETWESLVHVPLFVCIPGVAPRRVTTPRSLVDLAPTILELAHVEKSSDFRGTSLVAEVRGANAPARPVLVDLPANELSFARRALVGEKLKVVYIGESRRRLVYDLENDPAELHPIRSGPLWEEETRKLREVESTLREVVPSRCARGCARGWD